MDKFIKATVFYQLLCIFLILQFLSAVGEGGQNVDTNQPEKPFISKMVYDTISLVKKSHKSSWEKIKTVIHDLQMQFNPPNLDFRAVNEAESRGDGVKGKMKEAIGKSVGKSKETVEESAKSAAKVVGEAIHNAAENVKESDSEKNESDAEL